MDMSLISAALGAQASSTQLNLATDLMRMSADSARSVVQLLDSAAPNSLANVGAGIGTNLNITA
jgi:hypothetical protein